MTKIKFVLLALFLLQLIGKTVDAQLVTNKAVLERAGLETAQREKNDLAKLLTVAKQKGWPLTITGKQGRRAYLMGMDYRGYPLYVGTNDNIISAATIRTNQLWPGGSTGLNLSGNSSILNGKIAIWDEAKPRPTHVELIHRVTQKDNATALSDHSTHVAGTLIAAGVNPLVKGMAFGANQLLAYDFNNDQSEMLTASPGLLISNHSYGAIAGWNFDTDVTPNRWEFYGNAGDTVDYKFGYYDDQTQMWDSIAYNAPDYLIVKSVGNNRSENGPAVGQPYWRFNTGGQMVSSGNRPAGISNNDGYNIIPTYGTAKNILTIGAVNAIPGGYNQPSDVVLTDFSSWGPTDDGRIKPDLVTDGVNVLSSFSTSDNAYGILSGTSMASPAAGGSAFLLQDYYSKLHGGAFMRSATLKGILIHTADEAGPTLGPDYQYGWGLIDMVKAAAVITSNNTDQLIYENNLINGNSFTLPVVASGKGPLVATISWTDPKANVDEVNILNNPTSKLINDLDLRITSGATTYQPWVLNPKIPSAAATKGDNKLDNLEKIEVDSVVPGKTYTINITHKGTLSRGQQAYSLLVSGVGGASYCTSGPTSSAGTRIDSVNISNIANANPPGCTTYSDFTNLTVQLQSAQTLPFSIKLSSCDGTVANKVVKIFIDYNNNGTFTDPGENVATSGVINGNGTFTGTITTPFGLALGDFTVMRIVVEETSTPSSVTPCGNYGNGETQDYRVQFVGPANDVAVTSVIDPLGSACANDSQRITVNVQNFGKNTQVNIPLSATIQTGGTTVAVLGAICPDTIPGLGSVVYTFQTPFNTTVGNLYTITVRTNLGTDQDTANDQTTESFQVSAGTDSTTGTAEICSTNPNQVSLKANVTDSSDVAYWFTSPTATTPITSGNLATTSIIPPNDTYYMSLNDNSSKVGPPNKMVFPNGGYNAFVGNFVNFTAYVPLTLSSARLYIGHAGQIIFTVADIVDYNKATGAFSYYPISMNTLNVYPTTPDPQIGPVTGNFAVDTGAVYYLNLQVPTAGSHSIIIQCENGATIFRNNMITGDHYPFSIPGVFSITSNNAVNQSDTSDLNFFQQYYYFFYDMSVQLANCPGPKVAVLATKATAPVISISNDILTSNSPTGNQWYLGDSALAGANGQTDTAIISGTYYDIVTDDLGCAISSNKIVFASTGGGDISLKIRPNPSNGIFVVNFVANTTEDVEISLINTLGQRVYNSAYPGFSGIFDQTIDAENLSEGMYIVQVRAGGHSYNQKILIVPTSK
jgi:Subtilase family/GEVED domain/Secretion system C-terminal sorting domain